MVQWANASYGHPIYLLQSFDKWTNVAGSAKIGTPICKQKKKKQTKQVTHMYVTSHVHAGNDQNLHCTY